MSYYWFNRKELLQKAKGRYHNGGGKKEAGDYDIGNKDVFLKKANGKYKHLSGKEEEAKKEYSRNRYKNMEKNASQKSVKK